MTSVSAMNFCTLLVKHKYACQHREVKIGHCGKEWKEGNSFCSWKRAVGCVSRSSCLHEFVLHYSMISFVIFFCSPPQDWSLLTLLSMHLLVFICTWWAALWTIEVDLDDKAFASMCILAICKWVGSFLSYHFVAWYILSVRVLFWIVIIQ